MQSIKKRLESIDPSDFYSKVNLHIHTTASDGELEPIEVIKSARANGLKLISITDHNTVNAYSEIKNTDLEELEIIKGVEFDCWYGFTLLHILGYGIDTNNDQLLEICATDKKGATLDIIRFFNRRKAQDVIERIKSAGGIPVLAHPACCWNPNLKGMIKKLVSYGLEGVEVYYPYRRHRGFIKFYTINSVKKIADELGLLQTGGTDAHGKSLN